MQAKQTKLRYGSAAVPHQDTDAFHSLATPSFARLSTSFSHLSHLSVCVTNVPETTQAAANMPANPPNQSLSATGAEDGEEQIADVASGNNGNHAVSHSNSTTYASTSESSSTSQAATGDKRKRGDDAGELGDGIKRQMVTLAIRGRPAVAPPSYQEQQILIGIEAQTSKAELSESHEPTSSPTENQGTSEMQCK